MRKDYISNLFAVICLILTLVVHEVDFYRYCLTSQSYVISSGKINYVEDYSIEFRGQGGFIIRRADVVYEMNEKEYTAFDVPISYQEKEGSVINIAINKNDYTKVLRCDFLPLSRATQMVDAFSLMILLYNFIKRKINICVHNKKEKKILNQLNIEYLEKQDKLQLEIKKKQIKILSYYKSQMTEIPHDVNVSEIEHRLTLRFNEPFKWCMLNLPQTMVDLKMPLMKKSGTRFAFELETLRLREQGLPHEYYLIDKKDICYYCCKESSNRLYVYSKILGITNTPYSDIYDYILKKMQENS